MVIKEEENFDYNDKVLDQIEGIDLYAEAARRQEQFHQDIQEQGHDIEEVTFDDMFIEQIKTPERAVVKFDNLENKYDLRLIYNVNIKVS